MQIRNLALGLWVISLQLKKMISVVEKLGSLIFLLYKQSTHRGLCPVVIGHTFSYLWTCYIMLLHSVTLHVCWHLLETDNPWNFYYYQNSLLCLHLFILVWGKNDHFDKTLLHFFQHGKFFHHENQDEYVSVDQPNC